MATFRLIDNRLQGSVVNVVFLCQTKFHHMRRNQTNCKHITKETGKQWFANSDEWSVPKLTNHTI